MPQFDVLSRRYNSLRLPGYDYNSTWQLCAISLVTDLRRPLFADVNLAKSVLKCLMSDQTLEYLRVRAFTLMPDHLHLIAGVREVEKKLPNLIGCFKSYTTQQYWKRSREIVQAGQVLLPSTCITKSTLQESRPLMSALFDRRATLRPEVVELKNWPGVELEHFRQKHLWQTRFFDHVIRNDRDLQENYEYIAMNPVRRGYVTHPQFYPYTGFLDFDAGVATEGHPYNYVGDS
jgi:REP element-mobilizing transposase RayT